MAGNAKVKCPDDWGDLVITVERRKRSAPEQKKFEKLKNKCSFSLSRKDNDREKKPQQTECSIKDRDTYNKLCGGAYTLEITPTGEEAGFEMWEEVSKKEKKKREESVLDESMVGVLAKAPPAFSRDLTIEHGVTRYHHYRFYPYELRVRVVAIGKDANHVPIKNATVQATRILDGTAGEAPLKSGVPPFNPAPKTDSKGVADFGFVPKGSKFELTVKLSNEDAQKYIVDSCYGPAPAQALNQGFYEIKVKPSTIYLQLHYKDPEGSSHPFPKEFPVTVVFTDPNPSVDKVCQVSDDRGNLSFKIAPDKTKFTLKFDSVNVICLVHKESGANWVPDDTPRLLDPDDAKFRQLTLDRKRFFCLPKQWSLANCQWDQQDVTVPGDGKVVIPDAGIGTKDSPGKLTLLPRCQYVRFEYHDRRYGHGADPMHGDKRVTIPPIVLKGARKADATNGAPLNAAAGTHDTISNWVVEEADIVGKACQSLPWILIKDVNGADLPDLDKDMLLEFGWPAGFVCSEDATDVAKRKIAYVPVGDAKRQPSKDRFKYYDLPERWLSLNYYTRFTDSTKNKFFDELTPDDIRAAYVKTTPLIFSLDDIVLADDAGCQMDRATMDKAADGVTNKALSDDSRVAQLWLNPDNKLAVEVWQAAPAGYYSTKGFAKDKALSYRNIILEYAWGTRAVVFCSQFHDVYDKRTVLPAGKTFADKYVVGARSAKRSDKDVQWPESQLKATVRATDSRGDFAGRGCGHFQLHLLQYGALNAADSANLQMVFALVTYWSCRLAKGPNVTVPDPPPPVTHSVADPTDLDAFRNSGMLNAMKRWNTKDYEFRLTNRADLKGKTFALFEAKHATAGGKHTCLGTVVVDVPQGGGSSMGLDTANFRISSFQDEPARFLPAATADYDGNTYHCLALAHELGHASGLEDEYVYDLEYLPTLPRYEQYYDGMPYVIDSHSLMLRNQAIRLRHYWGKASWINANVGSIPGMTAADNGKLEIVHAGKNMHYTRPVAETLKHLYTPIHEEAAAAWSGGGAAGLYLYRLGEDEFAHLLKGGPYQAILVLVIKIYAKFKEGGIPPWTSGVGYVLDDVVDDGGLFYYCTTSHNPSGPTRATHAGSWGSLTWIGAWALGTAYSAGDLVEADGAYYRCTTNHTSVSFATDPDLAKKWIQLSDKGAWAAGTVYHPLDHVTQGGNHYVCRLTHTANPAFGTDAANWIRMTDKGGWASGRFYQWGDLVQEGGKNYFCRGDHTAACIKNDKASWALVHLDGSWSDDQKRQWLRNLGADLKAMVVDKYQLECGGNAFSKAYISVFLQYQVSLSGLGASAETHYELEIKRDGSAAFASDATKKKLVVGENCDNNKIIRHVCGKCDGGTGALTAADLSDLKSWIDGKASGAFTMSPLPP